MRAAFVAFTFEPSPYLKLSGFWSIRRIVLWFTILNAWVPLARANVTLNKLNLPASQGSAATNTFSVTSTTGNFVALAIAASTNDVITGVTDNKNNTYTLACPPSGPCKGSIAPGGQTLICYAKAATVGVTSLTVSMSSFSGVIDVAVYDLSGVDTNAPLDVAAELSSQSSTANPAGPAVTATTSGGSSFR